MNRLAKITAVVGTGVAIAVLPLVPAFADQGAAIIGSQAFYVTSSNSLSAQDTQADGKSAIAELRAYSGATVYSVINSSGAGTIKYKTVSMPTNYQIRACVQDISGGGSKSCTSWINGS